MSRQKEISIVGAGPVGSLLSMYLVRRGYRVTVFEGRPDIRQGGAGEGRSINLALSNRGIRALNEVGLSQNIKGRAIPMNGRVMHDRKGNLTFQPYGMKGQFINSISRSGLNALLVSEAEQLGVTFYFDHRCEQVDLQKRECVFSVSGKTIRHTSDILIGADGAFSAVRQAMLAEGRMEYAQHQIEHGYKELRIPPGKDGSFLLEKNALHIWPRESFMMIALPNTDGSFTCTLFFPFEGTPSFKSLTSSEEIMRFFSETFPDVLSLIPDLTNDFHHNPISSLTTVDCYPWVKGNTFLIGDAAHGIVPFFGQGMNSGFEDCRILNQLLDQFDDQWEIVLEEFQQARKPDADAIAKLALENFIEMRDHVADASFLLRKKIEAHLHELYPEQWIPLYSMVTFYDDIRYSAALATGIRQREIMDQVMLTPHLEATWKSLNFKEIVDSLYAVKG
jgi:kynurenine 3-monooxygenase